MPFIVIAPGRFYLVGTAFTSDATRARQFDTLEDAQAAVARAAKFHKKAQVKTWKIVETYI